MFYNIFTALFGIFLAEKKEKKAKSQLSFCSGRQSHLVKKCKIFWQIWWIKSLSKGSFTSA